MDRRFSIRFRMQFSSFQIRSIGTSQWTSSEYWRNGCNQTPKKLEKPGMVSWPDAILTFAHANHTRRASPVQLFYLQNFIIISIQFSPLRTKLPNRLAVHRIPHRLVQPTNCSHLLLQHIGCIRVSIHRSMPVHIWHGGGHQNSAGAAG